MAESMTPALRRRSAEKRIARPPLAVVVPAPREAGLSPMMRALAGQTELKRGSIKVFAAVGDRLASAAAASESTGGFPLELHLFEGASAPAAATDCRKVLEAAAYHLERHANGSDPVLLLLDPEAVPSPDWIASNLRALADGADLVCGNPVLRSRTELGRMPAALEALVQYRRLVVRLEDRVDPAAWDPGPRHGDESGASLALRLSTLKAAGGVPEVPVELRRHLIARVRQCGGKIRHCPKARVFVPPGVFAGLDWDSAAEEPELPVMVPDPGLVERSFRERAAIRARLERRHAAFAPAERERRVRSCLALTSAAVSLAPRTVPVEQAVAMLRARLERLERLGPPRGEGAVGPRLVPVGAAREGWPAAC